VLPGWSPRAETLKRGATRRKGSVAGPIIGIGQTAATGSMHWIQPTKSRRSQASLTGGTMRGQFLPGPTVLGDARNPAIPATDQEGVRPGVAWSKARLGHWDEGPLADGVGYRNTVWRGQSHRRMFADRAGPWPSAFHRHAHINGTRHCATKRAHVALGGVRKIGSTPSVRAHRAANTEVLTRTRWITMATTPPPTPSDRAQTTKTEQSMFRKIHSFEVVGSMRRRRR